MWLAFTRNIKTEIPRSTLKQPISLQSSCFQSLPESYNPKAKKFFLCVKTFSVSEAGSGELRGEGLEQYKDLMPFSFKLRRELSID